MRNRPCGVRRDLKSTKVGLDSLRIDGNSLRQYHECMNLGFPEMLFIFLLALIIFGPKKLPEIGRQIGRALNELRRASNEFKAQIESEISQLDVEPNRQTILPPAEPPVGSVAAGNHQPESVPSPDLNSPAKAPDA